MPSRYWDSSTFIGWLAPEGEKAGMCGPVIRAAQEGNLLIVTSSLTIAECLKLKGHPPLRPDAAEMIRAFFRNSWIVIRQLDRFTAEDAQDLVWNHGIAPKDAIHVATALRTKPRVVQLDTFDEPLIAKSGLGNPPLLIGKPSLPEQLELDSLAPADAVVEQLDLGPG